MQFSRMLHAAKNSQKSNPKTKPPSKYVLSWRYHGMEVLKSSAMIGLASGALTVFGAMVLSQLPDGKKDKAKKNAP